MPRYIRRNIYKLGTEWSTFATALDNVKTSGDYDSMVQAHQNAMLLKTDIPGDPGDPSAALTGTNSRFKRNAAHRGPSFLPWHRRFIQELESFLPSGVMVPYWPWEDDTADPDNAQVWTATYLGTVDGSGQVQDGPFAAWNPILYNSLTDTFFTASRPIERDLGPTGDGYLPTQAQVDQVLTYINYDMYPYFTNSASVGFRNRLEGFLEITGDPPAALSHMHNAVHIWVGGDMGPGTSPNDPVFFLHHCNVDRIWAKWQEIRRAETGLDYDNDYQPNAGGPPGHNTGDLMFPWDSGVGATTVQDMLNLKNQEFVYDDVPIVELLSTSIDFGPVIDGETAHAAAVFDIIAAFPIQFTLESLTGPDAGFFADPLTGALTSIATPDPVELEAGGYGWVAYTGEATPTIRTATAVIRAVLRDPLDDELLWQRDYTLNVTAESTARPSVATSLVLDQSNSMSFPSGFPGTTRMDVLHFSAPPFLELMDIGNGIGIVAFDHDAHPRMPVDAMPGAEGVALGHISSHVHNPAGNTSIADGIIAARAQLDTPAVNAGYDDKAIVILTDGYETAPSWLDDLPASSLDERVYAIGLGNESAIRPDKLQQVVNGASDGYLLLTGTLDSATDTFLLSKYFLKVLAGVENSEIGSDPEGTVPVNQVVRVPFLVTESDYEIQPVLLTEHPLIDMILEAPNGEIIDQGSATTLASVEYINGQTTQAYRVSVPVLTASGEAHAGKWHALLRLDPRRIKLWLRTRYLELRESQQDPKKRANTSKELIQELQDEIQRFAKLGVRYSFNVIMRSNLKMKSRLDQIGHNVGDKMVISAAITEYRQPLARHAKVEATIQRPDETQTVISLSETDTGRFEASLPATMPGVWRIRLRASGSNLHGRSFEREDLLTGWIKDPNRPEIDPSDRNEPSEWCELVSCLLSEDVFGRLLKHQEVDVEKLRACVKKSCEKPRRLN